MKCPNCGDSTTKHGIHKTQHSKKLNAIRRSRWCALCKERFVTYEVIVEEAKIQDVDDWQELPNIHMKS